MRSLTVVLLVGVTLAVACGSNKVTSPSSSSSTGSGALNSGTGAGVPPGTAVFTQSPIEISHISVIVPIGNLNPPDHTLPTNHSYFFHQPLANVDVFAPSGGTVSNISHGNDDQILINAAAGFEFYLGHVLVDSSISQGTRISAGQRLGVTASAGSALDLGVINNAVTLFFVRPERYITGTLHGDSPLKYFAEPVRSELYGKVSRTGGDKDGKIDFDRAGRLSGNWFIPDLQPSVTENFGNGSKHLSFARDVGDPSRVRISIGGSLSMMGAYFVQTDAIDPNDVSTSSGAVRYQLFFTPQATLPAGSLLVQMLADDRIKVEAFANISTPPADFTDRALTYIR